jgi:IPT/TIG domain
MPERDHPSEHPEHLLVEADRPRPLPPYLRTRLEEALKGAGAGDGEVSRPLPAQARDKLEDSLKPAPAGRPRKLFAVASALGAAAAVGFALAVGVPALVHGSKTGTTGVPSLNAATPPAQHTRLSPERSALGTVPGTPNGAIGAKIVRPAAGVSAAQTSVGATAPRPAPAVPVVGSVSPRTGPASGGNWVVVRGTGFGAVAAVHFGAVAASRLVVLSPALLKALAPPHAPGTVDVLVSGRNGRSMVSFADHYSYVG